LIPEPTATYTGGRYFFGLFVPANTPPAIVDRLYRETEKALRTPGVLDKFKPQGIEPMPMTSAEFDALIKKEIDINIALVKAANLKFN
jgi:tripartite-type tricarboxylate transporter receptor subunit TctC